LAHESITARRPALGMVVEVPAAALVIDQFAAEFFCVAVGTLTQYVTAASGVNRAVADLADPLNPAVLRLIAEITKHGRDSGREVILLGDMMGNIPSTEPDILAQLVHHGARGFSVAPSALAPVKRAIAAIDLQRKPDH
jgi:phosphotransferase system enzyme I (PtsI)